MPIIPPAIALRLLKILKTITIPVHSDEMLAEVVWISRSNSFFYFSQRIQYK